MPTYDYKCGNKKCGQVQEVMHGITADPAVACVSCGGRMKRLIGAGSGIIFKGTGYYCTDFRKKTGTPPESKATQPGKGSSP